HHGAQARIGDVDGQAGRDERGVPRLQQQRCIERGAQVQAGAGRGGIAGQRPLAFKARIKDLDLQGVMHAAGSYARRRDTRSSSSPASLVLGPGPSSRAPPGQYTDSALSSLSNPLPATPTRLAAIMSRPLASSL